MATATSLSPLESFQHLTDNLPTWLTKLDDLAAQVAEQNARFIRLSKESGHLIAKKKNNSTESLRPNETNNGAPAESTRTDTAAMPPPPPAHNQPIYAPPNPSYKCLSHASRKQVTAQLNASSPLLPQGTRKRKPTSTHPSAASNNAHPHYRTKSMIVVYYDSTIQEALEVMVKLIAGARNKLRKGKSTASFKARMTSMGMGLDGNSGSDGPFGGGPSDLTMLPPKMMRGGLGRTGGLGLRDTGGDTKMKEFEDADKELESAQSLCEVAAHQFLRDGDCRSEIEGTRKRFECCLSIAKKKVEQSRAEEEKEKQDQSDVEEKSSSPVESEKPDAKKKPAPIIEILSEKMMAPEPMKHVTFTGTGTIEIDDESDAESVQIDLSAIRRTTRA